MNYALISEVFMEIIVNTDSERETVASPHYTTVFTKSIEYTCLSSFEVVFSVHCKLWNKQTNKHLLSKLMSKRTHIN